MRSLAKIVRESENLVVFYEEIRTNGLGVIKISYELSEKIH